MLKSIVNGAEHDITRIPMKGKNLSGFDSITYLNDNTYYVSNRILNSIPEGSYTLSYFVDVDPSVSSLGASVGVGSTIASYDKDIKIVNSIDPGYVNIPFSITDADADKNLFVRFVRSGSRFTATVTVTKVMLNIGSTALPYEPYGYQNGWEVRDNQNRIIWGREDELQTTTGTLPFKGYDLPVKVKSLLGNSVQNGTPAPDNIITPEMCGVRTGNLFYSDRTKQNTTAYSAIDQTEGSSELVISKNETSSAVALSVTINLPLHAGTYTVSIDGLSVIEGNLDRINLRDSDGVIVNNVMTGSPQSFTIAADTVINAVVFVCDSTSTYTNRKIRIMLNSGSTALPYEPYGYKIPITNAGQTTPIYLGEVPTVRRVRKLVLTGTETWTAEGGSVSAQYFRYLFDTAETSITRIGVCSHFEYGAISSATTEDNIFAINYWRYAPTGNCIYMRYKTAADVDAFKTWLADEYAAGHPVTVWYVLANEQTGIVNEPLCKISTYVDELTTIKVHGLSAPLYGIGEYKDILNLSTGAVTRNIKKLVLTGTSEDGNSNITPQGIIYITPNPTLKNIGDAYCTHFRYVNQDQGANMPINSVTTSGGAGTSFWFKTEYTNVGDFKSYLAAQYAAGTPVTLWYVLATPKTETVTVPTGMTGEIEGYLTQISTPTPEHQSIPKWNGEEETGGTYAVTVYDLPEIETTTGKNTLTVDTTLAPYDVTINGHIKYTYWGKIREDVRSGLAQTKFPVGTILYDNNDETTGRAFQVVGYDKHFDPSLTARGYNHSMTLCQLKLSGPWQFDTTEAFLYVEQEMEPATYRIRMPDGYDDANGGNGRSYLFTTTKTIPVGGQITLSWASNSNPTSVSTYSSSTSTTALDSSRTLTLWDESTEAVFIGTIKYDNNTDDSVFGKLNQMQRVRYGSNNYYQSGLRQLLNTSLTSNNWWHPTTIFDRPYANRTTNGYLRSLNEDFINVLATPEITHIANNKFEYPSLDGRTFTLNTEYKINTDKVFLLSHTEVGLSASPDIGTVLDYYSTHNTNTDRIKYRLDNGNAYYWWLRTPYPTNAGYFRRCNTSGALDYTSARSSYGVAPAHIIQ